MTSRRSHWSEDAACQSADADQLFADSTGQNRAKAVCTGCPVRTDCLADALDNRVEWGVWGGMTERERRALLRRRPNVTSWKRVLGAGPATQVPPGGGAEPACRPGSTSR